MDWPRERPAFRAPSHQHPNRLPDKGVQSALKLGLPPSTARLCFQTQRCRWQCTSPREQSLPRNISLSVRTSGVFPVPPTFTARRRTTYLVIHNPSLGAYRHKQRQYLRRDSPPSAQKRARGCVISLVVAQCVELLFRLPDADGSLERTVVCLRGLGSTVGTSTGQGNLQFDRRYITRCHEERARVGFSFSAAIGNRAQRAAH